MPTKLIRTFFKSVRNVSTKPTTNELIKPFIYNRNPRNLEKLRLERKPTGYSVDNKDVNFWNKVQVTQHSRYVTAQLIHNTNTVVVEASTAEWAIRKFLYSAKDKQAYVTLARVFAERCLESGIMSMKCVGYDKNDTSNVATFYKVLEEEGLMLQEPSYYNINDIWQKKRETKPWLVLD